MKQFFWVQPCVACPPLSFWFLVQLYVYVTMNIMFFIIPGDLTELHDHAAGIRRPTFGYSSG